MALPVETSAKEAHALLVGASEADDPPRQRSARRPRAVLAAVLLLGALAALAAQAALQASGPDIGGGDEKSKSMRGIASAEDGEAHMDAVQFNEGIPIVPNQGNGRWMQIEGVPIVEAKSGENVSRTINSFLLSFPSWFDSHMVLPANVETPLWGHATPGTGPITITIFDRIVSAKVDEMSGHWEVTLPAFASTSEPTNITVYTSLTVVSVVDVLIGDVYICVGASNVHHEVECAANDTKTLADPATYGDRLRIMQVKKASLAKPQENFTSQISWQRAGFDEKTMGFSALCYGFGVEQLKARPDVPVGLIAAAWSATPMNCWAPPEALDECSMFRDEHAGMGNWGEPMSTSVCYYSMLVPLTRLAVRGFIINLQGDRCLEPASVRAWQKAWRNRTHCSGDDCPVPAVMAAQFGCNGGKEGWFPISRSRFDQETLLSAPHTGLAVTSDLCDVASPYAIMHSVYKVEESKRLALLGERLVHNNKSFPMNFPRPTAVYVDPWDESWGKYHYGSGPTICTTCVFGIRVEFDQEVRLRSEFAKFQRTMAHINGFTLYPAWGRREPYPVHVTMSAVIGTTVHLNVTLKVDDINVDSLWPGRLVYGVGSFPTLSVVNVVGMPVGQFNVSVPYDGDFEEDEFQTWLESRQF